MFADLVVVLLALLAGYAAFAAGWLLHARMVSEHVFGAWLDDLRRAPLGGLQAYDAAWTRFAALPLLPHP